MQGKYGLFGHRRGNNTHFDATNTLCKMWTKGSRSEWLNNEFLLQRNLLRYCTLHCIWFRYSGFFLNWRHITTMHHPHTLGTNRNIWYWQLYITKHFLWLRCSGFFLIWCFNIPVLPTNCKGTFQWRKSTMIHSSTGFFTWQNCTRIRALNMMFSPFHLRALGYLLPLVKWLIISESGLVHKCSRHYLSAYVEKAETECLYNVTEGPCPRSVRLDVRCWLHDLIQLLRAPRSAGAKLLHHHIALRVNLQLVPENVVLFH